MRTDRTLCMAALLCVTFAVTSAYSKIAVIVDNGLYRSNPTLIKDYIEDLEIYTGKRVVLDWSSYNTDPAYLRSRLRNMYASDAIDRLEGAIFIGDLPFVYYEERGNCIGDNCWNPEYFPCDLYFMDLDGTWTDTEGFSGVFDGHSGAIAAEIWVSRIMPSTIPAMGSEEKILSDYFKRVRTRLAGFEYDSEHREEVVVANTCCLEYEKEQGWADARLNVWGGASLLGYSINEEHLRCSNLCLFHIDNDSWSNLVYRLQNRMKYLFVAEHSNPSCIGTSETYFSNNDYINLPSSQNVGAKFYNLFACSACRFDQRDFMGGLFAWTGNGLVCVGSTKPGGMLNFDTYNAELGKGATIGEAFKLWLNKHCLFSGRTYAEVHWHYGMVILGTGELKIKPYPKVDFICKPLMVGQKLSVAPSFSFANNELTVKGGGSAGSGGATSDRFHFLHQDHNGDGSIVVQVKSISTGTKNQASVMMRENLDAGSRFVNIFYQSGWLYYRYRLQPNTATALNTMGQATLPILLKLTREGNVFKASWSKNGSTWYSYTKPVSCSMAKDSKVGLGVTTGSTTTLATAVFNNISFPVHQVIKATNNGIMNPYRFISRGNANWQADGRVSIIRSGVTGESQENGFRAIDENTGWAQSDFWWAVSSEANRDFLQFYIDGSLKDQISGESYNVNDHRTWPHIYYSYRSPGLHSYTWQYKKDSFNSKGQDRGWIYYLHK
ncbi:MAG: hypothetical protein JXA71_13305 [Chitinispirillaceae bacterium]|nr:hypothetical protein [Chitinispirillaceae bacterium]